MYRITLPISRAPVHASVPLPDAVDDLASWVQVHELVGHGDVVEGPALLVAEVDVGYPNVGHHLAVHLQPLGIGQVGEVQALIDPLLRQEQLHRVVLTTGNTKVVMTLTTGNTKMVMTLTTVKTKVVMTMKTVKTMVVMTLTTVKTKVVMTLTTASIKVVMTLTTASIKVVMTLTTVNIKVVNTLTTASIKVVMTLTTVKTKVVMTLTQSTLT